VIASWFGRYVGSVTARGAACAVVLAATGCLPSALDEPQPGSVDRALLGTWLARGDRLEQCMVDGVEYGPGTRQSTYLLAALDDRSYQITSLTYYASDDGRLVPMAEGRLGGLSQWRAWLVPLAGRRYLVCRRIEIAAPRDPQFAAAPADGFPTFELEALSPESCRLSGVVPGAMLGKLAEARTPDDRTAVAAAYPPAELRRLIAADPDAATPEDMAITVHRMRASTEPHVQQVLEAFHLVNPADRPKKFTPAEGNGT
jgi:hypothetical protein